MKDWQNFSKGGIKGLIIKGGLVLLKFKDYFEKRRRVFRWL